MNNDQTNKSLSGSWLASFFLSCLLNMLVFFATSAVIGGTAQNGKFEGGKYYVGSHGKYTEVSKVMFKFSSTHFAFMLITFVPTLLAVLISRSKFSGSIFRGHSRQQWCLAIGFPFFWLTIFLLVCLSSA